MLNEDCVRDLGEEQFGAGHTDFFARDAAVSAPFATEPVGNLAAPAFHIANERGLSAYDACYVVLAETMGAPLVTADRRLASATANAVLITG